MRLDGPRLTGRTDMDGQRWTDGRRTDGDGRRTSMDDERKAPPLTTIKPYGGGIPAQLSARPAGFAKLHRSRQHPSPAASPATRLHRAPPLTTIKLYSGDIHQALPPLTTTKLNSGGLPAQQPSRPPGFITTHDSKALRRRSEELELKGSAL